MATFDVEGYRKAAIAAGIPESEIENEIKFQTSDPAKADPFEKDEGGFKLGSAEQIQERLGNDWWHLPAGLAAIGAGIYGASKLMGGGPDDPNRPPNNPPNNTPRIDPTFDADPLAPQAPQATAPAPDRLQQAQQIIEANKQLGLGSKPVPPTAPVAAPGMPPTVAEMDAAFKAPAPMPTPGPSSPVTGAVNNAVKEMITEVDNPNMRPTYQKSKQNPIGPQAYNWVAGQQGPKAAEVWQNIVGDKNVPYSEFMERYKPVYEGAYGGGYGDPDPFNQPAKNASYRKPSLIPPQIKGSASPAAMGASAITAVIPALAIAGVEGYKGNKEAVDRELKDAWDSLKSVVTWPYDVTKAATKGDFGPLKDVLMSVNPATLLLNEANKNDKKAIQKMIQDERQAAQVGAGRGIAPPSAYMR